MKKKGDYRIRDSEEEEEEEPSEECHQVHRPEVNCLVKKIKAKNHFLSLFETKRWKHKRINVFVWERWPSIIRWYEKKTCFYFAIIFTKEGDHQTEKWRINIMTTQSKGSIVEMIGKLYLAQIITPRSKSLQIQLENHCSQIIFAKFCRTREVKKLQVCKKF